MRSLLASVVFVALAACSRCGSSAAPDAAVDAGQASARREPARAPARVCPSFTACAEACATADAGAQCYEASLFALEGATDGGRDLAAVARFAALACDQGEGRGCVRASRTDDALRALPSQCEAGQAEACELLVPLLEAADAGADAAARAARATQLLEAACAKPEPFACARLGSARLTGRLGPADVKGGVALLEQACTAGVAGACVELALELSRGRPPALEADPARALKFGRMARELSR